VAIPLLEFNKTTTTLNLNTMKMNIMKRVLLLLTMLMFALPLYSQRFVDVTEQVGIDTNYTVTRIRDVFNTGFEDLFTFSGQAIFGQSSHLQFLHNTGTGLFQNITTTSGLDLSDTLIGIMPFTGMQFYDLDKDGHRDAILGARRDNGAYIIVWGSSNGFNMMDTTALDSALNDGFRQSHHCRVLDINRDGLLDLEFRQAAPEHPPRPNPIRYFLNNGNRTFTEIFNPTFPPPQASCTHNPSPFPGFWEYMQMDYNSDGVRDFVCVRDCGWGFQSFRFGKGKIIPPNTPCWDPDTLGFEIGIGPIQGGLNMNHDFNNDGYVDFLMIPSYFFVSEPQPNRKVRYKNILPDSFTTSLQMPFATPFTTFGVLDFNGDGSLDIFSFIPRSPFFTRTVLWQNLLPAGGGHHNFLRVKLEGVQSNREGIGANVIIVNSDTTGGKWWRQIRIVNPVGQILHFGLGSTTVVDSIYVEWPSGRRDLLRNVAANQTLTIREGSSSLSVGTPPHIARAFHLAQNYPNPFNPTTTIRYEIPVTSDVKLEIFDVLGRKVSTLVNARLSAGQYDATFDASSLSSGVYFYRLQASGAANHHFIQTKKMILVK
jgi:hypothetical protein